MELDHLRLKFGHGNLLEAKGQFRIFTMQSDEQIIHYLPTLEISAYGKDSQEAEEMLKFSISNLFNDLKSAGESACMDELNRLGWKKEPYNKRYLNSVHVDKNGILQNFNLPKETVIEESLIEA